MWETLPTVFLTEVFKCLDAGSRMLAAHVTHRWQECCSQKIVWRNFMYDCDIILATAERNPDYDWPAFRDDLAETLSKVADFIRMGSVLNIMHGADVEVLESLVINCENLHTLHVSSRNNSMKGPSLRQLQNHLRHACLNNESLATLAVENINLTREPCDDRIQLYNFLTPHQGQNLRELLITTPHAVIRGRDCPPHVPVLTLACLKCLENLEKLTTALHECDPDAIELLSGYKLNELNLLCNASEDSVSVMQRHTSFWQVGQKVKLKLISTKSKCDAC